MALFIKFVSFRKGICNRIILEKEREEFALNSAAAKDKKRAAKAVFRVKFKVYFVRSTGFSAKKCGQAVLVILFAACAAALFSAFIGAAQAVPSVAFPDKYAAIVIDANTGRALYADRADMRRYPASLTKMMTLYLLFDAMKAGRVTAKTPIPISAFANSQPPTKLNLGAGQRIGAEDAAKALITKSANDIAVAIAEYLGGTEQNFARIMTLKARQLGMRNSNFANASGLPNMRNYSTARDLAILALALRRDFPRQYALFSTTNFVHKGHLIRGHNRLVANMSGVDGIKTGYTRMSGFNLASSRRMGNKSLVAVVMGGKTSALRDSYMAGLLTRYMDKAGSKKGFSIMPPAAPDTAVLMASAKPLKGHAAAAAASLTRLAAAEIPVPTAKIPLNAAAADDDSAAPAQLLAANEDGVMPIPQISPAVTSFAPLSDRERDSAVLMMLASQSFAAEGQGQNTAENAALRETSGDSGAKQMLDQIITASLPNAAAAGQTKPAAGKKSWIIQVAAGANMREAERIMRKTAPAVRKQNAGAQPYTEKFVKQGKTYYRVRFSGFASQKAARASCVKLKRTGHKCLVFAP